MQHKKLTLLAAGVLVAGGLLSGSPASAGEATASMLANTCAGCHGTDGVSAGPSMPSLAGMPAGYLKEVMADFASGDRPSTIMQRIAKGYSESEIAKISSHFAAQKWVNASPGPNLKNGTMVDSAKAAQGEKSAKKCGKCHEDSGRSIEDDTPRLAGQWTDYMRIKFNEYKDADLDMPQPKKMKKQIDKLSAEQLDAIAHFYASQK
ncbi:MAG: cytochrome c4 [Magnetococcales bacterium]|nr:cytochrome c4 [Magnetococcales bacterium]